MAGCFIMFHFEEAKSNYAGKNNLGEIVQEIQKGRLALSPSYRYQ